MTQRVTTNVYHERQLIIMCQYWFIPVNRYTTLMQMLKKQCVELGRERVCWNSQYLLLNFSGPKKSLQKCLLILFNYGLKETTLLSLQLINTCTFMGNKLIMPFNRFTFLFLTSQNLYLYAREIQTCFTTSWPEQFSHFLLVDGWVIS